MLRAARSPIAWLGTVGTTASLIYTFHACANIATLPVGNAFIGQAITVGCGLYGTHLGLQEIRDAYQALSTQTDCIDTSGNAGGNDQKSDRMARFYFDLAKAKFKDGLFSSAFCAFIYWSAPSFFDPPYGEGFSPSMLTAAVPILIETFGLSALTAYASTKLSRREWNIVTRMRNKASIPPLTPNALPIAPMSINNAFSPTRALG